MPSPIITSSPPTFHILIATLGKPCLKKMLDSLKGELTKEDAITIVFDATMGDFSKEWLSGHLSQITVIEQHPNLGFWGHGIRNVYQGKLSPKTTFIMHADDDDTYVPGSFEFLRSACKNPTILYIADMFDATHNRVVPSMYQTTFKQDDISTQCGIIPFDIAAKSIWADRYGGDFNYYDQLKSFPSNIVFLRKTIYIHA